MEWLHILLAIGWLMSILSVVSPTMTPRGRPLLSSASHEGSKLHHPAHARAPGSAPFHRPEPKINSTSPKNSSISLQISAPLGSALASPGKRNSATTTPAPGSALAIRPPQRKASSVEFNVLDYGATGDGETNDTESFAKAWGAACATANGYVHAPAGYSFLFYPVILSGPCKQEFSFQVDGTILAPQDPSVWIDSGIAHWLHFKRVSVAVQGQGTFDGRGQTWWANSCKTNPDNPCVSGPTALVFDTCTNVTIRNLAILNSQQIHLAFLKSSGILVDGVTVTAPGDSPNTDGIHFQNSSSAIIQNTKIGTGDDCVSIQTGSFNIQILNAECGPGHGMSVGGLGKSNSEAEVANVLVDTMVFSSATNGVRIKTWQGSSGYAKDFTFKNIQMIDTKNSIVIDQYYCDSETSGSCPNATSNVVISDVVYQNITGSSTKNPAVSIQCSETVACTGISLSDINFKLTSGGAATSVCTNAFGSATGNMAPPSCLQS